LAAGVKIRALWDAALCGLEKGTENMWRHIPKYHNCEHQVSHIIIHKRNQNFFFKGSIYYRGREKTVGYTVGGNPGIILL
jgi:hypothetical protein